MQAQGNSIIPFSENYRTKSHQEIALITGFFCEFSLMDYGVVFIPVHLAVEVKAHVSTGC